VRVCVCREQKDRQWKISQVINKHVDKKEHNKIKIEKQPDASLLSYE
jgi:hypothetical protein